MSGLSNEVGSLLGGGPNNQNFNATAGTAGLLQPTTAAQAGATYNTAQDTLTQQQALAQALASQVPQATASQAQLAAALQAQAAGGGPNPAAAQLAQATGQNVSNQAALMAGQRGAASNVGLIAREAAQQGAATQQQAVGQGAVLHAQQTLAAQQQLQNLAANQIGQATGQTNTTAQSAQNEQANILNAIQGQNAAQVGLSGQNAAVAQTNANNSAGAVGGLINSAGSAAKLFAKGGEVPNKKLAKVAKEDRLPLPDHIKGMADIYHAKHFADGGYVQVTPPGVNMNQSYSIGDNSPLASSAKWNIGVPSSPSSALPTSDIGSAGATDLGDSGLAGAAVMAFKGAIVPGKPKVNKNSEKNDVVPAMLTPKEIVLPLSVTQADDAPEKAKQFVAALLKKHGKPGKEEGEFKEALKRAIESRKK